MWLLEPRKRAGSALITVVADCYRRQGVHPADGQVRAANALTMDVREGGRVINAVVLLATGVDGDGTARSSECAWPPVRGAARNEFFAVAVACCLIGMRLVTSDAHAGLFEAGRHREVLVGGSGETCCSSRCSWPATIRGPS